MKKELIFLGTGAAELIPDPFCDCQVCKYARLHPEERRFRSAFLYDEHTCIDFGPDIFAEAERCDVDFSVLTDILITHTHGDHFSHENFNVVSCNIIKPKDLFTVHMSQEGYDWLMKYCKAVKDSVGNDMIHASTNGYFDIVPHKVYESFRIGDKEIFPVYGFHSGCGKNEKSFNYRITENGRTLLYALDTGVYTQETVEALSGTAVDILIMDATFGSKRMDETCTHLDAYTFVSQLETLAANGIITSDTRIYASHINHYNTWHHNEYQKYFDENSPFNVTVARDGMQITY